MAAVVAVIALWALWIVHVNQLVDERLTIGVFSNTWSVYAAPTRLSVGQKLEASQVVALLKAASYAQASGNRTGYYRLSGDSVEIYPGPDSYFRPEPARVRFRQGAISEITALDREEKQDSVLLEPPLVANLSGNSRELRRLIPYPELPSALVHAVLSAEDKRFFQHRGFDALRLVKSVLVNLKSGEKSQGGSTITMQLARSLWLTREKTWGRKFTEATMTLLLEAKLTKEKIFENYANEVYLGRRDTFEVRGFGQAAKAYFNKDARQLTLPESALVAGVIQRPSYFDPLRYPERAKERRDLVLSLMQKNGFITETERANAASSPLGISPHFLDEGDAPYFLNVAENELRERIPADVLESGSVHVYTSLDLGLQRAAEDAVRRGMQSLDLRLRPLKKHNKTPQVALIALDPHTGEVKAAVGGRSYVQSQLNRLLAKRQPGSAFKPFVYAAALGAPKSKTLGRITLSTILTDEPTTFQYGDETYEPSNFGQKYFGQASVRQAVAFSLNVATVNLAQEIGFKTSVSVAKAAGLKVFGTPAAALGAYEVTPIELAGAYTVFANDGEYVKPTFLSEVRSPDGQTLFDGTPERRAVLDPKVNFLTLQLLQDVVNYGTGGGARNSGLWVPAAGKTGTSRDGWFAGFISDLVCIVWVGYDDNTELELEAARTAVPIWGDFMKRAVDLGYQGRQFGNGIPPAGLTTADICSETGLLIGAHCQKTRTEYYLYGTEPKEICTDEHLPTAEETMTKTATAVLGKPWR